MRTAGSQAGRRSFLGESVLHPSIGKTLVSVAFPLALALRWLSCRASVRLIYCTVIRKDEWNHELELGLLPQNLLLYLTHPPSPLMFLRIYTFIYNL